MQQELLVEVIPGETRAALVEDGRLAEVFVEREDRASLVGNVYLGRVRRVMPAMSAAFVDIGLPGTGFLSLPPERAELPNEGAALVVQVRKDAIGTKRPQLASRVTLPGRLLVLTPGEPRAAVSRRIEETEAARLLGLVERLTAPGAGLIARTVAVGADEAALAREAEALKAQWADIAAAARAADPPALLYRELDTVPRILRDHVGEGVAAILIDDPDPLAAARAFCARFMPEAEGAIAFRDQPLFAERGLDAEIEQALEPRCALPSGGSVVIEATEALTVVDVNSGSLIEGQRPGETARRTNLEAAPEIARQLRLRNIAGLIVIDFIGMEAAADWRWVMDALAAALAADPARPSLVGRTASGLVEVTRPRRREPLADALGVVCPTCAGRGRVRAPEATGFTLLRALRREARRAAPGALSASAAPAVVAALDGPLKAAYDTLLARTGRAVTLIADPARAPDAFEIAAAPAPMAEVRHG